MTSMSIKAKLITAFGALLVMLVWMGGGSYYAVQKLSRLSAYANTKATQRVLCISLLAAFSEQKAEVRGFILNRDESLATEFGANTARMEEFYAQIEPVR